MKSARRGGRHCGLPFVGVLAAVLVAPGSWSKQTLQAVMKRRYPTQQDLLAAAKSYA